MKQFLCLSLLVCFASYASCGHFNSYRSSVHYHNDLYALCADDEFEYDGLKINSFLTVHQELGLTEIGDYALEESIDFHRLFNETEAKQLDEIRDAYHHGLIELYGENYFNDPHYKLENVMYQKLSALQKNLTSFKGKGENPFVADLALGFHNGKMEEARNLTLTLNPYKSDKPTPEKELVKQIGNFYLHLLARQNLTLALPKNNMADFYNKRIYKFDRFEPVKKSKLFNQWKEDSGKMYFDLHVPFQNQDSDYLNKTKPCVGAKALPLFYQLKGKIN